MSLSHLQPGHIEMSEVWRIQSEMREIAREMSRELKESQRMENTALRQEQAALRQEIARLSNTTTRLESGLEQARREIVRYPLERFNPMILIPLLSPLLLILGLLFVIAENTQSVEEALTREPAVETTAREPAVEPASSPVESKTPDVERESAER